MLSLTILASGSLNMALIACPDCQRKISSKAKQCIHCGCPISSALEKDIAQADQYRKWLGYFLAIPVLLGTGWVQVIANKLGIATPSNGFGEAKSFADVLMLTAPLSIGIGFIIFAFLRGWLASLHSTLLASVGVLALTAYIGTHLMPWFGLETDFLTQATQLAGLHDISSYFSFTNLAKFLVWLLFGYLQAFGWWYFIAAIAVGIYIGWWLHKDIALRWLQEI